MRTVPVIAGFLVVTFFVWFILDFFLFALGVRDERVVWPVIGLGWLLTAWYLGRRYQDARLLNAPKGRCPHCGYDLRATPDRCPECGHSADGRGTP